MSALLLPLALTFLYRVCRHLGAGRRPALLWAVLVWTLALTAVTELLSLFRLITFVSLLGFWSSVVVGLAGWLLVLRRRRAASSTPEEKLELPREPTTRFALGLLALLLLAIGVTALVAPPNTGDSLYYHMSRVAHWAQSRSVAHYPTHVLAQLHQNPGAEFIILHLQVLSGGDRFANLVQWTFLAFNLVAVSLVAARLGARPSVQVWAAVFAATVPMGILQASSTKNEHVHAFWLLCFVHGFLRLRERVSRGLVLATGASLGLAILTKMTAYFYAFPFVLWFAVDMLRSRESFRRLLAPALTISVLTLAPSSGHYLRNQHLYGRPTGPAGEVNVYKEGDSYVYYNEVLSPSALVSNTLRNAALHLGTPVGRFNIHFTERLVRGVHRLIGFDVNDPRTTWVTTSFAAGLAGAFRNENYAGNPLHFVLFVATACVLLWRWRQTPGEQRAYLASLGGGFLIFCLALKWQPWNSRLHLPLFILSAPLVAVGLAAHGKRRWADAVMLGLLLASFVWALGNETRPLVGHGSILTRSREEQYFSDTGTRDAYEGAARYIREHGRTRVGLVFGGDANSQREYPLWALLAGSPSPIRVENVDVRNVSRQLADPSFSPDAIVCFQCGEAQVARYRSSAREVHAFGSAWVFEP
ncbi:glycosyltransferase family 39 protein [Archangium violaceum]|uniref:glycosyltransferase family 39 protein n=1 Tax=Archangium violaceum TaxID=83451 RepID=UPI00194E4688|nr:glycosyltransferase family 39 protein [Archangium violaceum]QRN95966.1 glycosyltransferase family 39 protein [Archangium violaceum]